MSRQNPIRSGALLLKLEHIAAAGAAERRTRDEKLGHDLRFRAREGGTTYSLFVGRAAKKSYQLNRNEQN